MEQEPEPMDPELHGLLMEMALGVPGAEERLDERLDRRIAEMAPIETAADGVDLTVEVEVVHRYPADRSERLAAARPWKRDPDSGNLVPPWELFSDYRINGCEVAERPFPKL